MRITRYERFLKRVQSNVVTWFFRRCVKCETDVKRELMHRFLKYNWEGSSWAYLCYACAPTREQALEHWRDNEKNS